MFWIGAQKLLNKLLYWCVTPNRIIYPIEVVVYEDTSIEVVVVNVKNST